MSILDFKKQLKENKDNIEINKKLEFFNKLSDNIFYLGSRQSGNNTFAIRLNGLFPLIKLDEEDIDYFKNKYFKKLDEEMEAEVNKLKKQYE